MMTHAEAAIEFAINSGLRRAGADRKSFTRALRAYIRARIIAYPKYERVRIPIRRCTEIAEALSAVRSRRAAQLQADFLRAHLSGDTANANRVA